MLSHYIILDQYALKTGTASKLSYHVNIMCLYTLPTPFLKDKDEYSSLVCYTN